MSDKWARQNSEPAAILSERSNVNKNVSLQTGEEFSLEFLKDHNTPLQSPISRKTHNIDGQIIGDFYYQNHTPRYDNAARFHELRMESECPSDAYDFGRDPRTSILVENGGYMPHSYYNVGCENEVVTSKTCGEVYSNQGAVTGRSTPSVFLRDPVQLNKYAGGEDINRFGKVKFLCSFGGRIMPRSSDEKLKYVGGETHIISIRKNLSWEELKKKTSAICKHLHSIKYQLPGDDLDALISVSSDEDLQNMIEEYSGLECLEGSQRPRLFLIPIGEPEKKVQPEYAAAMNCMADPSPRKIAAGQTLVGDTRYHLRNLERTPSFCQRTPRLDTTAIHPNQLFNEVQYSMPSYPSPPISPSPFQPRDSNGGAYSQFPGNNSSSESNNSISPAQPDTCSFETIDSKYHQQQPLPSVSYQCNKHEAENLYRIQYQNGFSEKLMTPNPGHVDTLCFNPERSANTGRVYCDKLGMPEEPKVSLSGSTNSNDSYTGLQHSYSDSRLDIDGGHSSYFSQEKQSPSSTLNFTKKQTQEKPVQVHRNNDLAFHRTKSDILDLKSSEEGETVFKFFPSPGRPGLSGENKTLHIDISSAGNRYNEMYLNQETKNQAGNNDTIFLLGEKVLGKKAMPIDMEGNKLPIYGNPTSVVVDTWTQINQDKERSIAGTSSSNIISLEEGIAAKASNEDYEPHAARARNLEVSGILLNKRAGSDENFLFSVNTESANKKIIHEAGNLELDSTQMNKTEREGGLGHVRIPTMDLNQPAPETANKNYNLRMTSLEKEDSPPQGSPHIKMNNSGDPIFNSEDADANTGEKDNKCKETIFVEMEASVYGLQIIKNADLEDLTELGSGTYGTVYHGTWRGTDVAIKRIRKSCFAGRSSEQERLTKDFWREAQILSNLHHPNVVAFYGIVPDGAGGTLATVTEFMVNGSLRHTLLKKHRLLDARKKIIIAMDAAFGMEYLHSKNIVHFDLKCENLLVNLRDPQRPICKVGDLGLSRIKRNTLVSGGVRGTLPWMAPELLNGSSTQVSEKVDVYSYGISLWEILTGEEPYADMHCGAIIGGIVKNTLRPPIPKTCSPEWKKLMEQCWSVDPDSRPPFTVITSRLRSMSMELATKTKRKEIKP